MPRIKGHRCEAHETTHANRGERGVAEMANHRGVYHIQNILRHHAANDRQREAEDPGIVGGYDSTCGREGRIIQRRLKAGKHSSISDPSSRYQACYRNVVLLRDPVRD